MCNFQVFFLFYLFINMLSYKTLYASLLCMSHTCPSHSPWFDLPTSIWPRKYTCTYKKHENIPELYEIHVHNSFKHSVSRGALLSVSQVLSVIQSDWALILEKDSECGSSTCLVKYAIKKIFKQPSGRYKFDFMWHFSVQQILKNMTCTLIKYNTAFIYSTSS